MAYLSHSVEYYVENVENSSQTNLFEVANQPFSTMGMLKMLKSAQKNRILKPLSIKSFPCG